MAAAIELRDDLSGDDLRCPARDSRDAKPVRRLLALAVILDGGTRTAAARLGWVGLQIVRDWVLRFNSQRPEGLIDRNAPGKAPTLTPEQRAALARAVEAGPSRGATGWCAGGGSTSCTEPSPDRHTIDVIPADDPALRILTAQESASGLAAVWARENTREAIFDAITRKEVYATTGTRIRVRVFSGWDFEADDLNVPDLTALGYGEGVPSAFYYVRVIEIPTPRWTTHDAAFFEIPLPESVPPTVQDRAYTSPIWYTPS